MDFFNEYTSNYDMTDDHISYKYFHSIRVMDNMCMLAKNLNLSYCDIELAKCIGILHDIGRFEQYRRFGNFNDANLDHGDYGSELLRENNVLKHFKISPNDYEIVYKAIKNHNKYKISSNLNNREMLFAKMIRDADKLDILYALGNNKLKEKLYEDDSEISEHVENDFFSNRQIERQKDENINDNLVTVFSFIYDFNFNISLYIINKNKYYQKIYERINHQELFKKYYDHVNEYIEKKND